MGKGSKKRPAQISDKLADMKWRLAFGKLTTAEKEKLKEKIRAECEQNVPLDNRT